MQTLAGFLSDYLTTPAIFQTEHLCQWADSMLPRAVNDVAWQRAARATEAPIRPALGISVAPTRVVAVIAWQQSDGSIGLRLAADVTGSPVDVDAAGRLIRELAERLGVDAVGYAPATDRDLARYLELPGAELQALSGQLAAAASARFVATLEAGRLAWSDAELVGADLALTVRRAGDAGVWTAVPGRADRPIPAALAAIHAVWMATTPRDNVPTVH
jgi:hypothetical protein